MQNKYNSALRWSVLLRLSRLNACLHFVICQKPPLLTLSLWCTIIFTERRCHRRSFLSRGYTGWFAIAFPAVVWVGIWNLLMVPVIVCILFAKDIFNVHQRKPADRTSSLTSIQGAAHTSTNHPACETPGWQFIAGSGFKPRRDSSTADLPLHV